MPKYRHEIKVGISLFEYLEMRSKLDVLLNLDSHCSGDGMYAIRSLYFDNVYDKALVEKNRGVNRREKFRLRYYDDDTNFIKLEKKQKVNGLCLKTSSSISKKDVETLLSGNYEQLESSKDELMQELLFKMKTQGLRPKNIVKYDRRAYIYEAGNVRITFDMNLKSGINPQDFLDPGSELEISGLNQPIILEIKYDEFIPSFIERIVKAKQGRVQSFSKYAQCRTYI